MSFLLMFVLSYTLICNMDGLLSLWLAADAKIPEMTIFSQLILVYALVISLEPPISRIIQATGNIKRYQLSVGSVTLTYIPITALAFALGGDATLSLIILIIVMGCAQFVRIYVAQRQVNLNPKEYCIKVFIPIIKVSVIGVATYMLTLLTSSSDDDILIILLRTAASALWGVVIVGILGLNKEDRHFVLNMIKEKLHK